MDSLRGNFGDYGASEDDRGYDPGEDETGHEAPPLNIGTDERRMQVRAYNHWAGLLDNRNFPSVEDLDPENLPDFGPHSVLLDFTCGVDNPAIQFLGGALAQECGATGPIKHLDDVPSRSLLSRITDHYMQILANQAPIGFEAEFVNQRGGVILYRGILLPFSSDDDTIDFILGVINWKELADQKTTDDLLQEIDQVLATKPKFASGDDAPMTAWADGPADDAGAVDEDILNLASQGDGLADGIDWPSPDFDPPMFDSARFGSTELALIPETVFPSAVSADMGLTDWLASARELAQAAQGSEDRSRSALYAAIGRAYDFSVAAAESPAEFDDLVTSAGLTMQDRAPMTPVVKLVFGADYDKTRLTEFASALGHAHRLGIARGKLAGYLAAATGGLKGVVNAERALRRDESGKAAVVCDTPREVLARKLRALDHMPLNDVSGEGSEFTILMARRLPSGEVVVLGEIGDDVPLLERAARRLLG